MKPGPRKVLPTLPTVDGPRRGAEDSDRLEEQRARAGWLRRFTAEGSRAEEMIELYRKLGFEVVADPLPSGELVADCESCGVVAESRFQVIYTRMSPGAGEETP